jgi:hypothetical protein
MVPLKLVTFCYRVFPSSVELELMIISTVQGKGTGSGLLYGLVLQVLTEFTFLRVVFYEVIYLLFLDFTGHSWNRGTATVPSFDHACRTVGQK